MLADACALRRVGDRDRTEHVADDDAVAEAVAGEHGTSACAVVRRAQAVACCVVAGKDTTRRRAVLLNIPKPQVGFRSRRNGSSSRNPIKVRDAIRLDHVIRFKSISCTDTVRYRLCVFSLSSESEHPGASTKHPTAIEGTSRMQTSESKDCRTVEPAGALGLRLGKKTGSIRPR